MSGLYKSGNTIVQVVNENISLYNKAGGITFRYLTGAPSYTHGNNTLDGYTHAQMFYERFTKLTHLEAKKFKLELL